MTGAWWENGRPQALGADDRDDRSRRERDVDECLDRLIEQLAVVHRLTRMERLVLGRVARGQANKDISAALGSMPRTVEAHVASALRKLEAESRLALIVELWRTVAAEPIGAGHHGPAAGDEDANARQPRLTAVRLTSVAGRLAARWRGGRRR